MPDHYHIVDQVRALAQSTNQVRGAGLDGWAAAYSQACAEVNERLVRCQRLLQQGLRSEAIQLAEIEPRLLDSVAVLDFPERPAWDELTAAYGLPSAARVRVEAAAFLNEAYAQEDPLQNLLRNHRRLALMRAPLKTRIGVLRKLVSHDANNPIWTDDLSALERGRFQQLQSEFADAARRHDADAIAHLLSEIQDPNWTESPPQALLQAIKKADTLLRAERTRESLRELEGQLNDAFASSDPVRGRIARDRWLAVLGASGLAPEGSVRGPVDDALDWLERQDNKDKADRRHEADTQQLVSVLDDPGMIGPAVLERLGNAVLSHERGMSDQVQKRYLDRLLQERAASERRSRMILAASASAAVLLTVLFLMGVRRHARSNDADQAATAVSDMLELGELEQAAEFLKKLEGADAGLLDYPALSGVRLRFQAAQDREAERALAFDQAIRQAQQSPVTDLKPAALDTARSLARLDTEKAAVEQFAQLRQAAFVDNRDRLDTALAPRLEALSIKIAGMKTSLESARPDGQHRAPILDSVMQVQKELDSMGPELAHAGDGLQSLSRVLAQKLDGIRTEIDRHGREVQLVNQLTRAVEYSAAGETLDLDPFAELLKEYAKAIPNTPRARAFSELERESPAWRAVFRWNRLAASWRHEGISVAAPNLRARLEQASKFLAENPRHPDAEQVAAYQRHLEAMARRDLKTDAPKRRLLQLFSDVLVQSVWVVKVKETNGDSSCYYMNRRFDGKSNAISFLGGFDGRERSKNITLSRVVYSDWSPQTKIANKFRSILGKEATFTNWEEVMLDLMTAIRSAPEMDPLLQVALLRKVAGNAIEGSEALRATLTPIKDHLEQGDVDVNVPWMDPDNAESNRLRPTALEMVTSMPSLAEALTEARVRRERVEQVIKRFPRTVGWLAKEDNGWQVKTGGVLPHEGDLWVIFPEGDARSTWKQVGAINNGTITLLADKSEAMVEGRPVFVIIQTISKP
jgi:hypothetical protein